jgi:hypothetical protein
MEKFTAFTKKIFTAYLVVIGLLLVCAIYLSVTISMFERNNWDAFIFNKSIKFIIPIALAITMLLIRNIDFSNNTNDIDANAKKGRAILFVISLVINAMLLLAIAHLGAKLYNVLGAKQEKVIIEGKIIAVYNNKSIKSKNKRKKQITVYDIAQQREIKFRVKKKYEVDTYFKDTLTKGSLGFLYKK